MKSTAKAQAILRDVADKLSKRFANGAGVNSIRQASDANGWPMLFLSRGGNEAEGQAVIAVRMSSVDAVSKDVFGNQLTAFGPHIVEMAYEQGLATAAAGPNPPDVFPGRQDLQVCLFELIKIGARLQVKEIANGTAVTEAAMNAAAPALDIEELYWPNKSV